MTIEELRALIQTEADRHHGGSPEDAGWSDALDWVLQLIDESS